MSKIEIKRKEAIQFNSDPVITNDCISSIVTLRENALSEATIVANNIEGANYLSQLHLYDIVSITYAYEEDEGSLENDSDWSNITPIFRGWIIELTPSLTRSGEVVSVTAMNGLGLKMMRVASEYGNQSLTGRDEISFTDTPRDVDEAVNDDVDWVRTGDYPYLDESETSYSRTPANNSSIGFIDSYYKFEDLGVLDKDHLILNDCKLNFKARFEGFTSSAKVKPYLFNGTTWDELPKIEITWNGGEWKIYSIDMLAYYGSNFIKAHFNDFRLKFEFTDVVYGDSGEGQLLICWVYFTFSGTGYNDSLSKLREILTDENYGIIPRYVERILDTNDSSQYTLGTDYIYNDTLEYTYLNFPYQDAFMCLQDLIRLGSAMHYLYNPSDWKGLHWFITPDSELLIAPVGYHNVEGIDGDHMVEDKWTTRPLNDTPLIVRQDMVTQSFKTELPIANYVLVAGKYIYPINEEWTEGHASDWALYYLSYGVWTEGNASEHIFDEATKTDNASTNLVKFGNYSLKLHASSTTAYYFIYPASGNLNIDITSLSSIHNIPTLKFWIRCGQHSQNVRIILFAPDYKNTFHVPLTGLTTDTWKLISLELGSNATDEWNKGGLEGNPNWSNVQYIAFIFDVSGATEADIYIDNLEFVGNVIRGMYDNDSIEQYGCRFLTIKDSLASTDTLSNTDYSSPLAQLTLYELLRNRVVRTTGQISIPLNPIFKGGQIVHIHACYDPNYTDGDGKHYRINKDFRIIEAKHQFTAQGAFTLLTLTDDVLNSVPINNLDPYSMVMRMINPDFQSRTQGSLKISGGDFSANMKPITGPIPT